MHYLAAIVATVLLAPRELAQAVTTRELFITAAERQVVEENGRKTERWVPTDKALSFAWSDQPFVIHVPFVIERNSEKGEALGSKSYQINLNWRGFSAAENKTEQNGYAPEILSAGFHRLDGKPLFETEDDKNAPRFIERRDWLTRPFNLDLPRLVRQGQRPAALRRITFPGPAPVAYWILVDPRRGLPRDVWLNKEEALGTLEASVEEDGYPATRSAKKLALRIKANGWRIADAKVRWQGKLDGLVVGTSSSDYRYQDLGEQFLANTAVAKHQLTLAKSDPGQPPPKPATITASVEVRRLLDTDEILAVRDIKLAGDQPAVGTGLTSLVVTVIPYQAPGAPARATQRVDLVDSAEMRRREEQDKTDPRAARDRISSSAPTGRSALPNDWASERAIGKHRLLEIAFTYAREVVRTVDVYAMRLSELESNLGGIIAPQPTIASVDPKPPADDGFEEWVVKMNEEREKTDARVQEIVVMLNLGAHQVAQKRGRYINIVQLEQEAFPADTTPNRGLVDTAIGAAQTLATAGRNIPLKPTLTKETITAMHASLDALQAEIAEVRSEQAKLIEEGLRITKQLIETADLQSIGSRDNSEHLKMVRGAVDHFTDQRDLAQLLFYDAAGWHDRPEFQQAIAATKFQSDATQDLAKLMEAKIALAQARSYDQRLAILIASPNKPTPGSVAEVEGVKARVRADTLLRELLQKAPDNMDAKALMVDLELELISWIQAKLEREKRATMAAFRAYMANRGYYEDDPKNLWEGFKEYWCVCWGTSPISLMVNGGAEVVSQQAKEVGIEQLAIAKNQVSLLALRRLVRNGVTLAEARKLTTDQLAERMTFHTVERKPLDPAKARRLCLDIHETFAELADLRALSDGNAAEFLKYLERNYYSTFETHKGWTETVGDMFFSPLGVAMMFGPSAIMRVGGSWGYVSVTAEQEAMLVAQGMRVERARDVFATTFRLAEFGEKLGRSRFGPVIAEAIAKDQAFFGAANCTALERFLRRDVGRLAAALVIYGGVGEIASDSKIPGLRMLVDAVALLGVEELAYDILSRGGSPLRQILAKCEQARTVIAAERVDLGKINEFVGQLEGLHRQIASKRLSSEQLKQLEDIFEQLAPGAGAAAKSIAGVNKKENAKSLLKKAIESIKKGDYPGAGRALTAVKKLHSQLDAELTSFQMALQQAQNHLKRNPELRQVAPATSLEPMFNVPLAHEILPQMPATSAGTAEHFANYGDRALMANELEQALDLYREALHHAGLSGSQAALEAAERRLTLVSLAIEEREALKKLSSEINRVATHAMDVQEIAQAVASRQLIAEFREGSLNKVWLIKDRQGKVVYAFKQPKNADEIPVELFASAAAAELGIKVPACARAKLRVPNEAGIVEEVEGFVIRGVEGRQLGEKSEAALLAVKGRVAEQKVFRFWLGDTDGHFGNVLLGAEGPWCIDFGMGSLASDGRLRQIDGFYANNVEEWAEMVVNVIYRESGNRIALTKWKGYHWMREADHLLTLDELTAMTGRIQDLCKKDGGNTLRGLLRQVLPESEVEAAFETLKQRAAALEKAIEKSPIKFPKMKTASVFRRERPPEWETNTMFTVRMAPPIMASLPLAA